MLYLICQNCRKTQAVNSEASFACAECVSLGFDLPNPEYVAPKLAKVPKPPKPPKPAKQPKPPKVPKPPKPALKALKVSKPPKPPKPEVSHGIAPDLVMAIFTSELSGREAADHFKVSMASIYAIRGGLRHKGITGCLTGGSKETRKHLSDDAVLAVYRNSQSVKEIANQFDIPRDTVRRIKDGRTYRSITGHVPSK